MSATFFESAEELRGWLEEHHAGERELWIGFHKKDSGKRGITYAEALDEALCFGWIDGVRKSLDAASYTIRFTPRKPRSNWSEVNVRRANELAALGRMRPPGIDAFEERDEEKLPRERRGVGLLRIAAAVLPPRGAVVRDEREEGGDAPQAPRRADRPVRPRPPSPRDRRGEEEPGQASRIAATEHIPVLPPDCHPEGAPRVTVGHTKV